MKQPVLPRPVLSAQRQLVQKILVLHLLKCHLDSARELMKDGPKENAARSPQEARAICSFGGRRNSSSEAVPSLPLTARPEEEALPAPEVPRRSFGGLRSKVSPRANPQEETAQAVEPEPETKTPLPAPKAKTEPDIQPPVRVEIQPAAQVEEKAVAAANPSPGAQVQPKLHSASDAAVQVSKSPDSAPFQAPSKPALFSRGLQRFRSLIKPFAYYHLRRRARRDLRRNVRRKLRPHRIVWRRHLRRLREQFHFGQLRRVSRRAKEAYGRLLGRYSLHHQGKVRRELRLRSGFRSQAAFSKMPLSSISSHRTRSFINDIRSTMHDVAPFGKRRRAA